MTYRLDSAATRGWADRTMREGRRGTRESERLAFLFFFHASAWACRRALVRSHFAPRPTGSGGRRASRGILATGGSSVRVARYVTHGGTRPPRTLRLRCSGQANK